MYQRACRVLVVFSVIFALVYLKWLLFDAKPGNPLLFGMLIAAELFNVGQAMGFWYTIYRQEWVEPKTAKFGRTKETVDIFITVYGEPADVVERTIDGAMAIRHPRKKVWVLDDGPSPEIEMIAAMKCAGYLTRPDRSGAKAGNINAALARTDGDFVVIFDADHVPKPEFLERTMGAFTAPNVGFVQTPQSYGNRLREPRGRRRPRPTRHLLRADHAGPDRARSGLLVRYERRLPQAGFQGGRRHARGLDHRGPECLAAAVGRGVHGGLHA